MTKRLLHLQLMVMQLIDATVGEAESDEIADMVGKELEAEFAKLS